MKGKIIVFEGLDSSGKATQTKMLIERIQKEGLKVESFSFPRYNEFFGSIVGRHLMGEFGNVHSLAPEFTASLYAVDRYQLKYEIEEKLKQGVNFVMDRYITSNWGFQTGKFSEEKKQEAFLQWLKQLESRMPQPDLVFFLNMPREAAEQLMHGKDREKEYRKGKKKDQHEENTEYLDRVREVFLKIAKREKNWALIECAKKEKNEWKILSREEVHEMIWSKAKSVLK